MSKLRRFKLFRGSSHGMITQIGTFDTMNLWSRLSADGSRQGFNMWNQRGPRKGQYIHLNNYLIICEGVS